MTRVLLYSDEPMLAEGLKAVLCESQDFELLPTSNSLPAVLAQLDQDAPDLILMDLTAEITFAVLSSMKHAMSSVVWTET